MPATDSNSESEKPSILKNTRESKGLTLEIVHEATKIPMDALKAIEEGYSSRILSPFYYRGFIKNYAVFLGLNVPEVFKHYGLDQPSKPAAVVTTATVKTSRKPAEPNVFWEQLQEGFAFIFKPKTLKILAKIIGFLLLFFVIFKMGGCIASHMHKKVVKKIRIYNNVEETTSGVPVTPVVKREVVQVQSEGGKVEVAVRAIRNTWIQVKSDGSVVFQMTLSKGSMESWSADDSIELSGRDIERLDMEVNGKHIGSLGGGERRIRRVIITRKGLTVEK